MRFPDPQYRFEKQLHQLSKERQRLQYAQWPILHVMSMEIKAP